MFGDKKKTKQERSLREQWRSCFNLCLVHLQVMSHMSKNSCFTLYWIGMKRPSGVVGVSLVSYSTWGASSKSTNTRKYFSSIRISECRIWLFDSPSYKCLHLHIEVFASALLVCILPLIVTGNGRLTEQCNSDHINLRNKHLCYQVNKGVNMVNCQWPPSYIRTADMHRLCVCVIL